MPIALDGIAPLLRVQDMGRAIAFYRGVLGFDVVATMPRDGTDPHWCMLALGDIAIMLDASSPVVSADRGLGFTLYFGCPDVDRAYDYLRQHQYKVDVPVTTGYGMRQLLVRDPDGFELCLQHPDQSSGS
jgi:glyoxylase I family protein